MNTTISTPSNTLESARHLTRSYLGSVDQQQVEELLLDYLTVREDLWEDFREFVIANLSQENLSYNIAIERLNSI